MTIKILGFAGSTRTKSLNKKLVRIGLAAAEAAGAETSYLDLQHLNMPLYDEDQEGREGMPETVRTFRNAVKDADGLLIASPEYNGAPTAVLKNAIDWSTRPDPLAKDEPRGAVWGGTFVGLMCASPGSLGGLRGLTQLQLILSGIYSTLKKFIHHIWICLSDRQKQSLILFRSTDRQLKEGVKLLKSNS